MIDKALYVFNKYADHKGHEQATMQISAIAQPHKPAHKDESANKAKPSLPTVQKPA